VLTFSWTNNGANFMGKVFACFSYWSYLLCNIHVMHCKRGIYHLYNSFFANKMVSKLCIVYRHFKQLHTCLLVNLRYIHVYYQLSNSLVHLSVCLGLRACGVLMVKILNECTLSMLVYNLFLDRQCIIYIRRNISIHRSSWNINSNFQIIK